MKHRLLIDECLSPELAGMAVDAGHEQSTCSRNRGLLGLSDRAMVDFAVAHDFTLVTNNARDFRGGGFASPGGLYAKQAIHAGLICLNSYQPMDLERQRVLFGYALEELREIPDLVNLALEVSESELGHVSLVLYEIPPARS